MCDGQVVELDTPLALLQRKSLFSEMVGKTGTEASHRLYQMAELANRGRDNVTDRWGRLQGEEVDTVVTCSAIVTEV